MSEVQYGAKRRTIKKVLREKMNSWLATLPNELAVPVRQDVLVTGGSIASMLLGEHIRDFDVYLKTKESAFALATHYCNEFAKRREAANRPLERVPKPHVYFPNAKGSWQDKLATIDHPDTRIGIFVQSAGVVSTTDGLPGTPEYQYFEQDPKDEEAAKEYIADVLAPMKSPVGKPGNKEEYVPVFMSQNAITLSDHIQVVLRFTGNADEIHNNFDYVHATCSYDLAADNLILPGAALESMLARALVYRGSLYPICSLFRMRKFMERGWRITAGEITKMAFQISELNLNDIGVLRDQLIGVDAAYFHELLARVRDAKEAGKEIDSTYIVSLIDELA
jgi:hypothetical protein